MIDKLFTGKIRLRLLSRILLNPSSQVYLRQLQKELNVSSNAVRIELNKLVQMKLIEEVNLGDVKIKKYGANKHHPLYQNLRSIIFNYLGIDHLVEEIFRRLGNLSEVYLTGDFAEGKDSPFIDLVVVGNIDKSYYYLLVEKVEKLLDKKVRTAFYLDSTFSPQLFDAAPCVCIFKT